jgi:hypothetical protein
MNTEPIPSFEVSGRVRRGLICPPYGTHVTIPREKTFFVPGEGVREDRHYGAKFIDVRDEAALKKGFMKGSSVWNTRQWSAISAEEMAAVAAAMGIDKIEEGSLGENLIIEGIPRFSELPPGTLLFFESPGKERRSTILTVIAPNEPCHIPGDVIAKKNEGGKPMVRSFVCEAAGRRGLVGFVYSGGFVKEGDIVTAVVPQQKLYLPPQ